MNNFFIITNTIKDQQKQITNQIICYLESMNKKYTVYLSDLEERLDYKIIPEDTECILVLGGDGTLLRAATDTIQLDVPLLGVNLGNVGFMAEAEPNNLLTVLDYLMKETPIIEERMMLEGSLLRNDNENITCHALNDIVLTRSGSLKIITYEVYVNGQFLNSYRADGFIVSTPTGSTGYNMSAGGPIVEPSAKLILLTPICPHTISAKSIVLSAEDEIVVKICEGSNMAHQEVEVCFDGANSHKLKTGEEIIINKSSRVTKFVRLNKVSFLETLHRKMSE